LNPLPSGLASRAAAVRHPVLSFLRTTIAYLKKGPFLAIHLACVTVFFVPVTTSAVLLCVAAYYVRMFGISAGYHRYFSHRTFKTSRLFQFFLGCLGCSALQKGPVWWSAQHRRHHKHSDTEEDPHSPRAHGVWWSHVGWVLSTRNDRADLTTVRDLTKFPELRWLDRMHVIPGLLFGGLCYLIAGWSGVVWGFIVSTVLLYHGTFLVNSICHVFGRRRYATTDDSRNNALVAMVFTLGEGWHNNHHHYMSSANQGFRWWEIDVSYYLIRLLGCLRIVWDIRTPPAQKLQAA
jgi:stearoyl-CoA desaturase (delta-9 desaturase)